MTDISDFKQTMTSLLEQDKLQEFVDNMKQLKLVQKQLKTIAPIECNTCGILKPRYEYQNNGLKKCKDCLGLNKRKHKSKKKQRQKIDTTITDLHEQYLLFHRSLYTKKITEGYVRKLIHKTGDSNDITDIHNIINVKVQGIDWICDHLYKHYIKQDPSEYYKYYYFFNDMIELIQYKSDIKTDPHLEQFLKQYEKSILG